MISDGTYTYTYDAEGNIVQVVTSGGTVATYAYDALNHRVAAQTTSSGSQEYDFDYAGRKVSTWYAPNNAGIEARIYWNGQSQ